MHLDTQNSWTDVLVIHTTSDQMCRRIHLQGYEGKQVMHSTALLMNTDLRLKLI
jgi:hypothetical protein